MDDKYFTLPPYRLSERDTFAIEIFGKLMTLPEYSGGPTDTVTNDAYTYAREMLLAREEHDRYHRGENDG